MKTKHILLVCLLFCVLIGSCARTADAAQQPPLINTSYMLVAMDGSSPSAASRPTIRFDDSTVEGFTGCNNFGGTYETFGSSIMITDLYHTEMACVEPEGIMEEERTFINILRSVTTFWLETEQLTLVDDESRTLVFIETGVPVTPTTEELGENDTETVTNDPVEPPQATVAPPKGFKLIQDDIIGVGVYIPNDWVVSTELPGDYMIFQSYPVDKYVGGEPREEGDTKCDFSIKPENTDAIGLIEQWESDPKVSFTSLETVELDHGVLAHRIEVENLGTSLVYVFDLKPLVVTLTCFGEFSRVDEIASTVHSIDID